MAGEKIVAVSAACDDMRSRELRFLQEAARLGTVHLFLWSDCLCEKMTGALPKFSLQERKYFAEAVHYVESVHVVNAPDEEGPGGIDVSREVPTVEGKEPNVLFAIEGSYRTELKEFCERKQIRFETIHENRLEGYPLFEDVDAATIAAGKMPGSSSKSGKKKILVTGCYDYFHTGHIRFFEEVAAFGDLYVVIGSDKNVSLLKGPSHPLYKEQERKFIVQAIKYVTEVHISTGSGWMDAEPEIGIIQPDVYAVNEDGDKPEKREFCEEHGLEYLILKRTPKAGLPKRSSTDLRGF